MTNFYNGVTEPTSRTAPATEAYYPSYLNERDTVSSTSQMERHKKRSKSLKLSPIWATFDTLTASSDNLEYVDEGGGIVFPEAPAQETSDSHKYARWDKDNEDNSAQSRDKNKGIMPTQSSMSTESEHSALVELKDLILDAQWAKVDNRHNTKSSSKESVDFSGRPKPSCNDIGGYCERVDNYPK